LAIGYALGIGITEGPTLGRPNGSNLGPSESLYNGRSWPSQGTDVPLVLLGLMFNGSVLGMEPGLGPVLGSGMVLGVVM
jgi:hypothetical protein